jgi:hypothetical protein
MLESFVKLKAGDVVVQNGATSAVGKVRQCASCNLFSLAEWPTSHHHLTKTPFPRSSMISHALYEDAASHPDGSGHGRQDS